MKKFLIVIFLCFVALSSFAQTIDLSKYVWKKTATTFTRGANFQGAAYYKGKFYQFHDRTGGVKIFDVKTMTLEGTMTLKCDGKLHYGSVSFSNEFSYTNKDGNNITTTLPLIYATGHYDAGNGKKEIVDVIDVDHDVLVRQYEFPERKDDAIAAWDFENRKCWIIHYGDGYAVTDYYINEYTFDENGYYPVMDGDESVIIPNDGTLQDCEYVDGHIYILVGWGESSGHLNTYTTYKQPKPEHIYGKIHDYNVGTKSIERTLQVDNVDEFEGFAYVPDTKSFIVTSWTIGTSNAYYWHVALPGTEPYYTTLAAEGNAYDRYNVDAQKNYEIYTLSLDDMAGDMGLPGDAASVTAAKINYQRSGVSGVNSVCMPFALKPEMVNGAIYTVTNADANSVMLTKQTDGVAAGVPCFVKSDSDWDISLDCMTDNGGELYNIPLVPVAPEETATAKLFGSFETQMIKEGFYKINSDGTALVRTTSSSKTFPYRAYLQLLPTVTSAKISFTEDGADAIKSVVADNTVATVYNLSGQRVKANAKGILIINGRKVIR